jgi:hypothetical protein
MPVLRPALPAAVLAAVLTAAAAPLSAQWPKHRSAPAPRGADGAVNLLAPAPRTPAGTPDFSGVWENVGWRELQQRSGDISGTGGSPGTGLCSRRPGTFFDIAAGVGRLPPQPWPPSSNGSVAANSKDNPRRPLLAGQPAAATHPQPRKIIQTAESSWCAYEGNAGSAAFHRRSRCRPTTAAVVVWLPDRPPGGRHVGGREHGIPRRRRLINGSCLGSRPDEERRRRTSYYEGGGGTGRPEGHTRPWTVTMRTACRPTTSWIGSSASNERSTSSECVNRPHKPTRSSLSLLTLRIAVFHDGLDVDDLATVELILARLRKAAIPAMAKTVGAVSALTSSEDTSTSVLADTVLQDYGSRRSCRAWSTRWLRAVGQVTTVRAPLLMGFDRIRTWLPG